MDIGESIKQDKEEDRIFEELKNQELFGKKIKLIVCPSPIPQVAPMNMMITVGFGWDCNSAKR